MIISWNSRIFLRKEKQKMEMISSLALSLHSSSVRTKAKNDFYSNTWQARDDSSSSKAHNFPSQTQVLHARHSIWLVDESKRLFMLSLA